MALRLLDIQRAAGRLLGCPGSKSCKTSPAMAGGKGGRGGARAGDAGSERIWELMGRLFKTHPWHGVPIGPDAPRVVTVYVEIVPSDTVKYEVDKPTGHLKVDRPQKFSNVCPTLYGFIPQTYSDRRVAELARRRTGRRSLAGDGDPLDVCVF